MSPCNRIVRVIARSSKRSGSHFPLSQNHCGLESVLVITSVVKTEVQRYPRGRLVPTESEKSVTNRSREVPMSRRFEDPMKLGFLVSESKQRQGPERENRDPLLSADR